MLRFKYSKYFHTLIINIQSIIFLYERLVNIYDNKICIRFVICSSLCDNLPNVSVTLLYYVIIINVRNSCIIIQINNIKLQRFYSSFVFTPDENQPTKAMTTSPI